VPAAPRLLIHREKLCASPKQREIDLVGYDGDTLVFAEVRTCAAVDGKSALPELSISREKHHVFVRTAHYLLRERNIGDCPMRFDVVDIDNRPGHLPIVRLPKFALSPEA
jgi:Holliday junction resolvase-like predicted endonuclease